MCPGLDAVVRDVDRQVPEEAHAAAERVLAQRVPLPAEHELLEGNLLDLRPQASGSRSNCRALTIAQRLRPLPPGCGGALQPQCFVQRVWPEPAGVAASGRDEIGLVDLARAPPEAATRLHQLARVVGRVGLACQRSIQLDPAGGRQRLEVDQAHVAGVIRARVVG